MHIMHGATTTDGYYVVSNNAHNAHCLFVTLSNGTKYIRVDKSRVELTGDIIKPARVLVDTCRGVYIMGVLTSARCAQRGTRPGILINETIVVPMTTIYKKYLPTHLAVDGGTLLFEQAATDYIWREDTRAIPTPSIHSVQNKLDIAWGAL